VGFNVGSVGSVVGFVVGSTVGLVVGSLVGLVVGSEVGLVVGSVVGFTVGMLVGLDVGSTVGSVVYLPREHKMLVSVQSQAASVSLELISHSYSPSSHVILPEIGAVAS